MTRTSRTTISRRRGAQGAADGYARVAGRPSLTLMHTGSGLANGLSNLHNARRGPSPIVNIVGDHADYHLKFDAPLTSDVEALARPMSHYVARFRSASSAAAQMRHAIEFSRRGAGRIVTLVLPADIAWNPRPAVEETAEEEPAPPRNREASRATLASATAARCIRCRRCGRWHASA